MIGRGLLALALLSNCVLSLPVTSSQLENEDTAVMKCIVEALADVLSRPRPLPVSQECLVTLKKDDRLVSTLRHHSFLRELQEIALEGDKERAQQQNVPSRQTPLTVSEAADQSMLEALGSPGERSILSEKKRGKGTGDGEGGKPVSFLEEDNEEKPERRASHSAEKFGEAEKRSGGNDDGKKRATLEEGSREERTGAGSAQKRHEPANQSTLSKEEDHDKRALPFSHQQEEKQESREDEEGEEEAKKGSVERLPWTKREKALSVMKKKKNKEEVAVAAEAQQMNSQQEVPHHSKELSHEEEVVKREEEEEEEREKEEDEGQKKKKKRNWRKTAEEKELQMIASKHPEEKRTSEEEGSASRKSEEQEIESLAAIESELENVAQKLHDLRRG